MGLHEMAKERDEAIRERDNARAHTRGLESENASLRDTVAMLQAANDSLREGDDAVEALRLENQRLHRERARVDGLLMSISACAEEARKGIRG